MKIITKGAELPCTSFVVLDDQDNAIAVGVQLDNSYRVVRCWEPDFSVCVQQSGIAAKIPKVLYVSSDDVSDVLSDFRQMARRNTSTWKASDEGFYGK